MPLNRNPQAVSLGELVKYYQISLNSSWMGAFGNAKEPTTAPSLCSPPLLNGMRVIRSANPGSNEARYVREGIHESPREVLPERFKKFGPEHIGLCMSSDASPISSSGFRAYFLMSRETAELNKRAEAQHLDDHRIAYDRSLGLLEKLLKGIQKQGVPAMPVPQNIIVVKMLESEMRAQRVSSKVFAYAKMGLNLGLWRAKYAELVKKSQNRDNQGWHQWALKYVSQDDFNRLWKRKKKYYLNGKKSSPGSPVYIEVTKCPSFNLMRTFDQIPG